MIVVTVKDWHILCELLFFNLLLIPQCVLQPAILVLFLIIFVI